MRHWLLAIWVGVAACGSAHAGSVNADLGISVTVVDRCLVRTESRSASCAGGAPYAVGVGRERIAVTSDQLTGADEHVHTANDGPGLGISHPVAGAAERQDALAGGAMRTVAEAVAPIDAIRVTYSF